MAAFEFLVSLDLSCGIIGFDSGTPRRHGCSRPDGGLNCSWRVSRELRLAI